MIAEDPQAVDFPNRQPYEGIVMKRDDPEGLDRVRIQIPGQWEPYGPWVLPVGGRRNGGSQRGTFGVPPQGALVLVFFVNGAIESPRYFGGHHGTGEIPSEHAITDDPTRGSEDNTVHATSRQIIELDERLATHGIRIKDRVTGQLVDVDIDTATMQVGISTTLGVNIQSAGSVRITGTTVLINGRPVLPNGPPI